MKLMDIDGLAGWHAAAEIEHAADIAAVPFRAFGWSLGSATPHEVRSGHLKSAIEDIVDRVLDDPQIGFLQQGRLAVDRDIEHGRIGIYLNIGEIWLPESEA